jgi:linoleoyl-CoA desaturase
MHDGSHGGVTENKHINYLYGLGSELIFSSSVIWRRSHNFGHHSCVNHYELDRAFDTTYPIYRMHKQQPWAWWHAYQHIYMWFLYSLVNFAEFWSTFDELQWKSNYPVRRGHISPLAVWAQVLNKTIAFSLHLFLPAYLHGFWAAFTPYLVFHSVMGYTHPKLL